MSDNANNLQGVEQKPKWWWPLRAHSRAIMLAGLPVALIVALYSLFADPTFESQAMLEVQTGNSGIGLAADGTEISVLMNTQKEIVSSATVAGDYRFDLQVEVIPQTYLLSIRFQAADPLNAQMGANAVAQAYVAYTQNAELEQIRRAAEQLIVKLESVTLAPLPGTNDVGDRVPDALAAEVLTSVNGTTSVEQMRLQLRRANVDAASSLETGLMTQLIKSYDDSLQNLISAKMMKEADLPRLPIEQVEPWWIILGYLSAVAVPAFVLTMRFQRRDTVEFKQDVETMLGQCCIGVLPALNLSEPAQFLSDREYAHYIGILRARLHLARPAHDPLEQFPRGRVVLMTSTKKGEGVSSIAMNLAFAMGKSEKVLLINADMRTENSFVGLSERAPGLSHLIAGAAQMRDCVHQIAGKNIYAIPSGVLPPNPEALLSSKRFHRVLEMLERRFDTIIIDAPALGDVSDTLVLARLSTDILYVVEANTSKAETISVELSRLESEGVATPRVVLNRVRPYDLDPDLSKSFKQ